MVWLFSHERDVMPVMDNTWKMSWRASWNPGGMCFKLMSGTPSGPAALWFGDRRRASCMIAGKIHSDIMGVVYRYDIGTRASHGNGAPGGSLESGDNALI